MRRESEMLAAASGLRRTISDLFQARPAERIVLAPGILVGLHILFAQLGVRRILVTSEEYYDPSHFPAQRVRTSRAEAIPELLRGERFDAVIASPVSWRGERLAVDALFQAIRDELGEASPLLVADTAHAGAIGFPEAGGLGADLVCGDLEKWILPPDRNTRIAFLWSRSQPLAERAAVAFQPFFLATEGSETPLLSRWVDPTEVLELSRWLEEHDATRASLRERHLADLKLARWLSRRFGSAVDPVTSILWLDEEHASDPLVMELAKMGLAWRLPGRGIRVLARSDVVGPDWSTPGS